MNTTDSINNLKESSTILGAAVGSLAILTCMLLAGCGERVDPPSIEKPVNDSSISNPQPNPQSKPQSNPQSPLDLMTDEDKAYYAHSFTTIGTVPFGRCWPENLYRILSAGRDTGNADKVMFNAPDEFKQNERYSEWLRVKSVIVDTKTRKVIGTRGRVGPFKDVEAVNAYLNFDVRPDLNSQVFIIKNETKDANRETPVLVLGFLLLVNG